PRSPGKAPKTSRRAQPKPRSSAAASPATDAAPGCAPRPRHKRTRPRSSDPRPASTPASTPPNRLADATESHRKPKFQNLSAQLLQQPASLTVSQVGALATRTTRQAPG